MVMLRIRSSISTTLLFIISFFLLISSSLSQFQFSSSSSSKKYITQGSSISSAAASSSSSRSTSSFWLSPSGFFAFGFYPLNSCNHHEFIIGIWLVKSSQTTLVWSMINRDGSTFTNDTSLHFTYDGEFVIRTLTSNPDENNYRNNHRRRIIKETPLFIHHHSLLSSSITYASLLDTGNLVFYNSDSDIIWESFDYPTDTILAGQTLNPGQSLVSRCKQLTMKKDGNLVLFKANGYVDWESHTKKKSSPIVLRLNSTGHLYLVDWNGYIKKRLNNNKKRLNNNNNAKQRNDDEDDEEGMIAAAAAAVLYRATLDSDGEFRLYKEIIRSSSLGGCECEKTENCPIILWGTKFRSSGFDPISVIIAVLSMSIVLFLIFVISLIPEPAGRHQPVRKNE